MEGWHRRLNNIVDSTDPGFCRFMSDLQTEQLYVRVDGDICQLVTGVIAKPKTIKTQQTASRVLRILENSTIDNIHKLKAIAHTFTFELFIASFISIYFSYFVHYFFLFVILSTLFAFIASRFLTKIFPSI